MSKPKTPDHQKSVLKGDTYVDPFTGLQEKSTGPTTDPFTGGPMGRPTGVGLPPKMSIPVYMRGDRESYHKYGVAVLPQVDMEERRAQQQSNWEKWNHGFAKLRNTAAATAVEGTIGLTNGLIDWAWESGGRFDQDTMHNLWDNATGRFVDEWKAHMEEKYPHYKTRQQMDSDFSLDKVMTVDFISDEVFQGLGYAAGAILPALVTKGGSLIGTVGSAASKGAKAALKKMGYAGLEGASRSSKLNHVIRAMQQGVDVNTYISNQARKAYVLNAANRFRIGANMAHAEAAVEGRDMLERGEEAALAAMAEEQGVEIYQLSRADRERAKKLARKYANAGYLANLTVLHLANTWQFGKSLYPKFKDMRPEANDFVGRGNEWVDKTAKKTRAGQFMQDYGKPFAKGVVTEAWQEGTQFAIGDAVETLASDPSGSPGAIDMIEALGEGYIELVSTPEGIESMVLGAMIGGGMSGGRSYFTRKSRAEERGRRAITAAMLSSPEMYNFAERTKTLGENEKLFAIAQTALANGDWKTYRDVMFRVSINEIMHHDRMGTLDYHIQNLNDLANMTKEEFAKHQGIPDGVDFDHKQIIADHIRDIESFAEVRRKLDMIAPGRSTRTSIGEYVMGKTATGKATLAKEQQERADKEMYKTRLALRLMRAGDINGRVSKLADEINENIGGEEVLTPDMLDPRASKREETDKDGNKVAEEPLTMDEMLGKTRYPGMSKESIEKVLKEISEIEDPVKRQETLNALMDMNRLISDRATNQRILERLMDPNTKDAAMKEEDAKEEKERKDQIKVRAKELMDTTMLHSDLEHFRQSEDFKDMSEKDQKEFIAEMTKRRSTEEEIRKRYRDYTIEELRNRADALTKMGDNKSNDQIVEMKVLQMMISEGGAPAAQTPTPQDPAPNQNVDPKVINKQKRRSESQRKQLDEAVEAGEPVAILNAIDRIQQHRELSAEMGIPDMTDPDTVLIVEEQLAKLTEEGYEIIKHRGNKFATGMLMDAEFIEDESLADGEKIIDRVYRPEVRKDGKLVQSAKVRVRMKISVEEAPVEEQTPNDIPTPETATAPVVTMRNGEFEYNPTTGLLRVNDQPVPGKDKNFKEEVDRNFIKDKDNYQRLKEGGVEFRWSAPYTGTDGQTYQAILVFVAGTDIAIGYLPDPFNPKNVVAAEIGRRLNSGEEFVPGKLERTSFGGQGNFLSGFSRIPVSQAMESTDSIAAIGIATEQEYVFLPTSADGTLETGATYRRMAAGVIDGMAVMLVQYPNGQETTIPLTTNFVGEEGLLYLVDQLRNVEDGTLKNISNVIGIPRSFIPGLSQFSIIPTRNKDLLLIFEVGGVPISIDNENFMRYFSSGGEYIPEFKVGRFDQVKGEDGRINTKFVMEEEPKPEVVQRIHDELARNNDLLSQKIRTSRMQIDKALLEANPKEFEDPITKEIHSDYLSYITKKLLTTDHRFIGNLPVFDVGAEFSISSTKTQEERLNEGGTKRQEGPMRPTTEPPGPDGGATPKSKGGRRRSRSKTQDTPPPSQGTGRADEVNNIIQGIVSESENYFKPEDKGNPNPGKYTDKRTGQAFVRSSDIVYDGETFSGRNSEAAAKVGSHADELLRRYFATGYKYEGYDSFYKALDKFKAQLEANGETPYTDGLILADPTQGVAGEADMITVDQAGRVRIYDFKTMKSGLEGPHGSGPNKHLNAYENPYEDGQETKRVKHTKQQSIYRNILFNTTGVLPVEVNIIAVKPTYTVKSVLESEDGAPKRYKFEGVVPLVPMEAVTGAGMTHSREGGVPSGSDRMSAILRQLEYLQDVRNSRGHLTADEMLEESKLLKERRDLGAKTGADSSVRRKIELPKAFRMSDTRIQDLLLNFLTSFGFTIQQADDLVIDLATKQIAVDSMDNEQVAAAIAEPLAYILGENDELRKELMAALEPEDVSVMKVNQKTGQKYKAPRFKYKGRALEIYNEVKKEAQDEAYVKELMFANRIRGKRLSKEEYARQRKILRQQQYQVQSERSLKAKVQHRLLVELLKEGFEKKLAEEMGMESDLYTRLKKASDKITGFLRGVWSPNMADEFAAIRPRIEEIVNNTVTKSKYISTTPKDGYTKIDFQAAFDQNEAAKAIQTAMGQNPNLVLTGSIALSVQGDVYRNAANVVHDLDYIVMDNDGDKAEQYLYRMLPETVNLYKFATPDMEAYTYVVPPPGYKITNLQRLNETPNAVSSQVTSWVPNPNSTKVMFYSLTNMSTGEIEGYFYNQQLPDGTYGEEQKVGVQGTFVDLFFNTKHTADSMPTKFTGTDGVTRDVMVNMYYGPMAAKLDMSRHKDLIDFGMFIPKGKGKGQPGVRTGVRRMDIDQSKKWIEDRFGEGSAIVFDTVQRVGDEIVHGYMENGAAYLWSHGELGTEYHEGFHMFFRTLLTDSQRQFLYKDYVKRFGKPTAAQIAAAKRGQPGISEREAYNLAIEERLAEMFRKEMIDPDGFKDREPAKTYGEAIARFFEDLIYYLRALVFDQVGVRQAFKMLKNNTIPPRFARKAEVFSPGRAYMLKRYKLDQGTHAELVDIAIYKLVQGARKGQLDIDVALGTAQTSDIAGGPSTMRDWFLKHAYHKPGKVGSGFGVAAIKEPLNNEEFKMLREAYDEMIRTGDDTKLADVEEALNIYAGAPDSDANGNPMGQNMVFGLRPNEEPGETETDENIALQEELAEQFRVVYEYWFDEYNNLGGRTITGFRTDIKDKLKTYGIAIKDKTIELDEDATEAGVDKIYNLTHFDIDPVARLGEQARRKLIIPIENTQASKFGFQTFLPISEIFGEIAGTVANSNDFSEMLSKLKERSNTISEMKLVYDWVRNLSDADKALLFFVFSNSMSEFKMVLIEPSVQSEPGQPAVTTKIINSSVGSIQRYFRERWLAASSAVGGMYTQSVSRDGEVLDIQLNQNVAAQVQKDYSALLNMMQVQTPGISTKSLGRLPVIDTQSVKELDKGVPTTALVKRNVKDGVYQVGRNRYIVRNLGQSPDGSYQVALEPMVRAKAGQVASIEQRSAMLARVLMGMGITIAPSMEEAERRLLNVFTEGGLNMHQFLFSNTDLHNIITAGMALGKDTYSNIFKTEGSTMNYIAKEIMARFESPKSQSFFDAFGNSKYPLNLTSDFHLTERAIKDGSYGVLMKEAVGSNAVGQNESSSLGYMLANNEKFKNAFSISNVSSVKITNETGPDTIEKYDDFMYRNSLAVQLALFTQDRDLKMVAIDTQADRKQLSATTMPNFKDPNVAAAYGIGELGGENAIRRIADRTYLLDLHRMYVTAIHNGGNVDTEIMGYHSNDHYLQFQLGGQVLKSDLFTDAYTIMSDAYHHIVNGIPRTKALNEFLETQVSDFEQRLESYRDDIVKELGGEKAAIAFIQNRVEPKNGYIKTQELQFLKDYVDFSVIGRLVSREFLRGGVNYFSDGSNYVKRSGHSSTPGYLPFIAQTEGGFGMPSKLREITIKDIVTSLSDEELIMLRDGFARTLNAGQGPGVKKGPGKFGEINTDTSYNALSEEGKKIVDALVAPFKENNGTDGQGLVTMQMWKYMQQGEGNWSQRDTNDMENYMSQLPGMRKWEGRGILSVKPSYDFRNPIMVNGFKHLAPVIHKNSYIVLTDEIVKGIPLLENLLRFMERHDVQIANTESAKKGASLMPVSLEDIDVENVNSANIQTIDSRGLKFPQTIKEKEKFRITFGKQPRKNMVANLDPDTVYNVAGTPMTGTELIEIYNKAVVGKLFKGHESVLEAIGYNAIKEAKTPYARKQQMYKLLPILRDLVAEKGLEKDYSTNFVDSVEVVRDQAGNVTTATPVSFPGTRGPLENMLVGMFRSNSYIMKLSGQEMVQFAEFDIRTQERDKSLGFYKLDGDRVYAAEVDISYDILQRMGIDPGASVEVIQEGLDELLGYRIPQQSKASMYVLKIRNVIKEHKGVVRVPPPTTTMMGSDFDIDKLFIIMPEMEVIRDAKGKPYQIRKVKPDYRALANMTQEEVTQLDDKILNNVIFDIFYAVGSNIKHAHESIAVMDLADDVDPIVQALKAMGKPTKYKVDINSPHHQIESGVMNMLSMALRGIYANGIAGRNALDTLIYMYNFTMGEESISFLNPETNDIAQIGQRLVNVNGYNYTTDQILSMYLGRAVDSVKNPIQGYINDNATTAPITVAMLSMGFSPEQIIYFLNVPDVKLITEAARREGKSITRLLQERERYKIKGETYGTAEVGKGFSNKIIKDDSGEEDSKITVVFPTNEEMLLPIRSYEAGQPAPKGYDPLYYKFLIREIAGVARRVQNLYSMLNPDNIDQKGTIPQHLAMIDRMRASSFDLTGGFETADQMGLVLSGEMYPMIGAYYTVIAKTMRALEHMGFIVDQPAVSHFKSWLKSIANVQYFTEAQHRDINTAIAQYMATKPGSPIFMSEANDADMIKDVFFNGGLEEVMLNMKQAIGTKENIVFNSLIPKQDEAYGTAVTYEYLKFDKDVLTKQQDKNLFISTMEAMIQSPELYGEEHTEAVKKFVNVVIANSMLTTGFSPSAVSYFSLIPVSYWTSLTNPITGEDITTHFNKAMEELNDESALHDFKEQFLYNYGTHRFDGRTLLRSVQVPELQPVLMMEETDPFLVVNAFGSKKKMLYQREGEFKYRMIKTKGSQYQIHEGNLRNPNTNKREYMSLVTGASGEYLLPIAETSLQDKNQDMVSVNAILDSVKDSVENAPEDGTYTLEQQAIAASTKIISGGQTGVDRMALDLAKVHGYATGGQAPANYYTEDGNAPELAEYGLTAEGSLQERTRANVENSDVTVIFSENLESTGTKQTINEAKRLNKPVVINPNVVQLKALLINPEVTVINIAGSRLSTASMEFLAEASFIVNTALNFYDASQDEGIPFSKLDLMDQESAATADKKIARLKKSFSKAGVQVEVVYGKLPPGVKGQVQNGKVTLDPNQMAEDTVYHEFGHILLDMLPIEELDRYIEQAIRLNPTIAQMVSVKYPELTGRDYGKEVLTTVIGLEGARIERKNPSKLRILINKILRALGKLFGIEPNAAAVLAEEMFAGQIRRENLTGNFSAEVQRSVDLSNKIQKSYEQVMSSLERQKLRLNNLPKGPIKEEQLLKIEAQKNTLEAIMAKAQANQQEIRDFMTLQQFVLMKRDAIRNRIQYLQETQHNQFTQEELFTRLNMIHYVRQDIDSLYSTDNESSTIFALTKMLNEMGDGFPDAASEDVRIILGDFQSALLELSDLREQYIDTLIPMMSALYFMMADPNVTTTLQDLKRHVVEHEDISGFRATSFNNKYPPFQKLLNERSRRSATDNPMSNEEFRRRALAVKLQSIDESIPGVQQLNEEIRTAQRDKSFYSAFVDPILYSNQNNIQLFALMLKEMRTRVVDRQLDYLYAMEPEYKAYKEYMASLGIGTFNVEKFNEPLITTIMVPQFFDGEFEGFMEVKSYVQPYDTVEFRKQQDAAIAEAEKATNRPGPGSTSEEWKIWYASGQAEIYDSMIAKWNLENTEPIEGYLEIYSEMVTNINMLQQRLDILQEAEGGIDLEQIAIVQAQLRAAESDRRSVVDDSGDTLVFKGRLVRPKDKYISKKYKYIMEQDAEGNYLRPALKNYYEFIIKGHQKYQDMIGGPGTMYTNSWDTYSYQMPSVRRDFVEGFQRQDEDSNWWEKIKDQGREMKNSFLDLSTDTEFGLMTEVDGSPIRFIPKFFTNRVSADDVTSDVASAASMFAHMAINYEEKAKMHGLVIGMLDAHKEKGVLAVDNSGIPIIDTLKSILGERYIPKGDNYELKHLENFVNAIYYGEEEIRQSAGRLNLNKVTGKMMSITAANSLSLNSLQVFNQLTLDNLMSLEESVAGEFWSKEDHGWAILEYFKLGAAVSDYFSLVPKTKLGQMMDYFDAKVTLYDELGNKITDDKARKLLDSDTYYIMQSGIDHQISAVRLLSLLKATKPLDVNGNEIVIDGKVVENMYDAMIESDGRMKLHPDVDPKMRQRLINRMHGIGKRTNQVKGSFDSAVANRHWFFKMLFMFRNYIPGNLRKKWGHDGSAYHVDHELGTVTRGQYHSFMSLLASIYDKGFMNADSYKEAWEGTSDIDKANNLRTAVDVAAYALSGVVFMALSSMLDDDEEDNYLVAFMAYQAIRLQTELTGFVSLPEAIRLTQRPLSTANNALVWYDLMKLTVKTGLYGTTGMFEEDVTYQRAYGKYEKGDLKIWNKFNKTIPALNGIQSWWFVPGSTDVVQDKIDWFTR